MQSICPFFSLSKKSVFGQTFCNKCSKIGRGDEKVKPNIVWLWAALIAAIPFVLYKILTSSISNKRIAVLKTAIQLSILHFAARLLFFGQAAFQ